MGGGESQLKISNMPSNLFYNYQIQVRPNYDETGFWFSINEGAKTRYVSNQAELRDTEAEARYIGTLHVDRLIREDAEKEKLASIAKQD